MKILVIEDEHRIANSLKKGFEQEGYLVDLAYTGTEGYDLISTSEYDCLVLDLMLPEMSGEEICRKLRLHKNHTPIIVLSAKGETTDKINLLNIGADDYLAKPFSFEELLARVRALNRRPANITSDILTVKGLSLDPTKFTVTRDGKPIKLSKHEYRLLEYLMRHPGQIVTKDQIIDHVWEFDASILPNTVEVYIRNIRKKIDLPFGKQSALLTTVRGFGYQIG